MSSIACRQKGNAAFARSDYASAITQYTLALAAADKASDRQKLFSNRCVCILPGHLLSPALCPRSLGHNAKHVCSSGPPLIYSFLRILMLWKMQTQLCKLLHGELCHLLCAIFKLHPVSHETCFSYSFTKALFRKALALEALLQTQQALQVMLLAQHQEPQDTQVSITSQLLSTTLHA